jgi:hypothetical protein
LLPSNTEPAPASREPVSGQHRLLITRDPALPSNSMLRSSRTPHPPISKERELRLQTL